MRLSEDVIYSLLGSSPNGLLVTDAEARIVFLNDYVVRPSGYRRDELLGQSVEVLVPDRSRTQHSGLRQLFARAPRERSMGSGRDLWARRRTAPKSRSRSG